MSSKDEKAKESRPNIVFILIDDMGWKDLGCQGSEFYETPNIDKIAAEGIRFTRAYASCPVCSPTRASFLTGKYPARVGITQWIGGKTVGKVISAPYTHYLPLKEKTLPKILKEYGYRTYHVGKWHLGDEPYYPEHQGFDVNVAGCHWGNPYHGYFSPYKNPKLEDGPKGEYLTDRLTDEAIQILETNGDAPFFLYLPYYSVHTPVQAPKEDIEYFKEKRARLGLDKKNPYIREKIDFFLERGYTEYINHRVIQSDPTYAAMIYRLDKNIGRLMKVLKDLGKSEDTIVVFYSDNGGLSDSHHPPTSNLPLRLGKSYVYEGGIREPLLIRWPSKIKSGEESDAVITTPDLYPTLLECCNIPLQNDQHVDGKTFRHLLDQPSANHERGPIYWHYPHYNGNGACPASVVIDGDWKLIEWLENSKLELYNLSEDVGERSDLSKERAEIRDRLLKKLREWRQEVQAKMPKQNPDYYLCLARVKVKADGVLKKSEERVIYLNMKISPENPMLYDVPVSEILDPFFAKTINLKVGTELMTGRLEEHNDVIWFYDTHKENKVMLADLVDNFRTKQIRISGWDDYAHEYLDTEKILPQVEITMQSISDKDP